MSGERDALLEERDAVYAQLAGLRHRYMTRPMPFRRQRRQFSPLVFLNSVVAFYLLLGSVGVWLIFYGGNNWADLGIGLLVGALFGIGSLIAAMWEAAFNWWSGFMSLVYESENDEIRQRGKRILEIEERLEDLAAEMNAMES